jgi:hypothetical protein
MDSALKSESAIQDIVSPYLGGNDPLFGKSQIQLIEYFDTKKANGFSNNTSELQFKTR